jgi:hypothetical protein
MSTQEAQTAPKKRNKIALIVKRMTLKPLVIMLDNKKLCEIENDMLTRMQSGARYTASDWSKLLELLVVPKAPEANVFVKETSPLSVVRIGETFVWVRLIDSCWTVTVCKPADKTVTNSCVSHSTGERKDLGHIADMFGFETHFLRSTFHQVRESSGQHLAAY